MAARLRKTHQEDVVWKWYVYKFFRGNECVYVGKGSGKRFSVQSKRFKGFHGEIVACFKHEQDALSYEKANILELKPQLNVADMPETPKPWTVMLLPEDKDFDAWHAALGGRDLAARILVAKGKDVLDKYNIDFFALLSKVGKTYNLYHA